MTTEQAIALLKYAAAAVGTNIYAAEIDFRFFPEDEGGPGWTLSVQAPSKPAGVMWTAYGTTEEELRADFDAMIQRQVERGDLRR